MTKGRRATDAIPQWLLAIGPLIILGAISGLLYFTSPFGNIESMSTASTLDILWMLTIIGAIAGVVPVVIGMLWFPFIRALDHRYIHAFLALSAGVLAFIAFEMVGEVFENSADAESTTFAWVLAVLGFAGTFAVMYAISKWRQRKMVTTEKSGLTIAYLVAVALGLHSIGEGMAIGVAFIQGEGTLVMLLVVGFVMHNVMEGPTVVAAVARDTEIPPLRHFAAMGLIAGGPVIVGGWIGSLSSSSLLAALFYAVAVGAILQVLIEVAELIRFDAEAIVTRLNAATFIVGVALMFVLEDVIVEGYIVP
ncbi:metal cation transporter [Halobacteria archaeon AArc-m2/3/4]|uniref:Metal cation transporter n=1 Tax=Natronoglomus mannanivorans TaxID=2979990 RepID=A0AAP2YZI3_9EURY|nr:metal cation transporter [Halobacteria archaeon AArc-xg1-1]MCU4971171.1 metal cation transporter [Halobacteria archaeon AArc-m2/3/4]